MDLNINNLLGLFVLGVTLLFMVFLNSQNGFTENYTHEVEINTDTTNIVFDLSDSVVGQKNSRLIENFNYIHPKFKKYNKNIDKSITNQFIKVMMFYDLDETENMRKLYTGQVLLESGARHRDRYGDIVLSYAGAVGLTQIMPRTCVDNFKRVVKSIDSLNFIKLGATDFSFAYDKSTSNEYKVKQAKKWLSNVNNNIILWGFITKNDLKNTGDLHKQLVAYNTGLSGMYTYISKGGICSEHKYLRGIRSKLSVASK